MAVAQRREELARSGEAVGIGAVEADDDLLQVVHLREHVDDAREPGPVHLGDQRRNDQRHGALCRPCPQVALEVIEGPVAEVVERRDDAVLEEVTHGAEQSRTCECLTRGH